MKDRFELKFAQAESGCWLWTAGVYPFGHGKFAVGGRRADRAHRVSWRLYRGDISDGLCVLHRCDVPACVNPKHLFLGTKLDNNMDKAIKGRADKKLSNEDARAIREDPRTQREVAAHYGVSISMVSCIRAGKYRRHA